MFHCLTDRLRLQLDEASWWQNVKGSTLHLRVRIRHGKKTSNWLTNFSLRTRSLASLSRCVASSRSLCSRALASSLMRSMSPLRMYLVGRTDSSCKALRFELISALSASIEKENCWHKLLFQFFRHIPKTKLWTTMSESAPAEQRFLTALIYLLLYWHIAPAASCSRPSVSTVSSALICRILRAFMSLALSSLPQHQPDQKLVRKPTYSQSLSDAQFSLVSRTTPTTLSALLPRERISRHASNFKGHTTRFARVRELFINKFSSLTTATFHRRVGESLHTYCPSMPLNPLKIAKFDEQRENGTFPASLEP